MEVEAPGYAEHWKAICINANLVKSRKLKAILPCCRNSGEMTTSLTNTYLNYCVLRNVFEVKLHMIIGVDVDFFVEGDDMIIGFNATQGRTRDEIVNIIFNRYN